MRIKTFILGTVALLSLSRFFSPVATAEEKPLIFAGDKSYPPIEYLQDGIAKGLNVELLQALSRAMGRKISVRLMLWNDAQQKVLNGQADALTFMSPSEEREKLYDFSDPTLPDRFSIFVQSDNLTIHNVSDLKGKRVGVTRGGYPRKVLEGYKKIHLVFIKNYLEGFQFLLTGKIDSVALDTWVGAYTIQKHKIKGVKAAGEPFAERYAAIAVKKGNVKLLQEINNGIQKLKKDGTIERLIDKWSSEEVVFLTRKRIRQVISLAIVILGLIAVILLWIKTLRKEVKRKTALLLESEEFSSSLLNNSPNPIVVINQDSSVRYVNPALENLTCFSSSELIGRKAPYPWWTEDTQQKTSRDLGEAVHKGVQRVEELLQTKNGEQFWVEITSAPIRKNGEFKYYLTNWIDITERKHAEELIKASLRDKEVLLKEIHHRVKNNLQVISSLLDMTSMRIHDQQANDLITDARSKIHTMALIHARLYRGERFDQIDMRNHILELLSYLSQVYSEREGITPVVEPTTVTLAITQAIPCALVLNEVISNAFKHAFRQGQKGIIEISIKRSDSDTIFIRVKDDGIGIPEEVDIYKTDSLGLKLLRNLVQNQLKGKIDVKRDKGTEFIIEFKTLEERAR